MDPGDEADDRWRDVLFALVKGANSDPEFRARVEATGAKLDNLEAVLERARVDRMSPCGAIECHTYWWGFQLEIPHQILRAGNRTRTQSPSQRSSVRVRALPHRTGGAPRAGSQPV